LRDLVCHLSPDSAGVRALVHLLLGLEILNAECMRRFAHRTIRTAFEAWRRGETDAGKGLYALTRKRKVYGKPLEAWYAPPEPFRRPPPRTDTRSARAAAWAKHDELCLAALTDVVATHEAAKWDVLAGRVDIPPLPRGPFASLLPIRRPWWTPYAVHLCSKHVQESLAELYEDTDDRIETYPLKAHDRLKAHHEKFVDGHLPIADSLTMGARLPTGRRKGVPHQTRSTQRLNGITLDEERVANAATPPGFYGITGGLRYKENEMGAPDVEGAVSQNRGPADLVGDGCQGGRNYQSGDAKTAQAP